jgi:hypothetical protein
MFLAWSFDYIKQIQLKKGEIYMFCSNCGKPITEGSLFCENCGASVGNQQQPIQPQPQYQQSVQMQPQYQQPVQPQPQYQQPVQTQQFQQQPYYAPNQNLNNSNINAPYAQQGVNYKKKYNGGNIILLFACIAVIASVFLPCVEIDMLLYKTSINLIRPGGEWGDGIIILGLAAIVLVLDLLKVNIGNIIGSVAMIAFCLYEINSIYSTGVGEYVTYGIGFYLFIGGSVVMLVASVIGLMMSSKAKKEAI